MKKEIEIEIDIDAAAGAAASATASAACIYYVIIGGALRAPYKYMIK